MLPTYVQRDQFDLIDRKAAERRAMKRHDPIPKDHPVQPLRKGQKAEDRATCGTCGLSWDDGKVTSMTPAPSARCPFEAFHRYPEKVKAPSLKLREFAVRVALKAMVDRLHTVEADESRTEYEHGVVETAAAVIQDLSEFPADVGDITGWLQERVDGLNDRTRMSEQAFGVLVQQVCEKYL